MNRVNSRLRAESKVTSHLFFTTVLVLLSGYLHRLSEIKFAPVLQANVIGHAALGYIAGALLIYYSVIHFKRVAGLRRPILIFTGLIAVVSLLSAVASGFWIGINGQSERLLWVVSTHKVSVGVFSLFTIAHIIWHYLQRKQEDHQTYFKTVADINLMITVGALGCYLLVLFAISSAAEILDDSKSHPTEQNYQYSYGDHPFKPSETETSDGDFVATAQIAKSGQCRSCHEEIYKQWFSSSHRQAASDPAYVKNINLLEASKGISATRYCEGCHAPVALLSGQLTPGGKHGGVLGTPANKEGVGCLGCHGISEAVHTNGTASYVYNADDTYLFENAESKFAQSIRNLLIRLFPAPHKVSMSKPVLKDSKLCATCHEQFMDEDMNDWGWVQMQSEYKNWLKSPFSGQGESHFQNDKIYDCKDCHFPKETISDPSSSREGLAASHRSLGANTVLPWLSGDKKQYEATKKFLESAKILVNIEAPSRRDSQEAVNFVDRGALNSSQDNAPFFLYLGEEASLQLSITNRLVGHTFPAGTTDINQAWLHFTVRDAEDRVIFESGKLNEEGFLDPTSHISHSIPVDRHGKEVWKHDLFRMTGTTYKNLIEAGRSDLKSYTFTVPSWATSPINIEASVKYRKFNQRYANWVFGESVKDIPVVQMGRDTLNIPLKIKPIIETNNYLN